MQKVSLRIGIVYNPCMSGKFDAEIYARKRYATWDQRLVHKMEFRIIGSFIKEMDPPPRFILDIPCGYGRFLYLLGGFSNFVVSSDLSAEMLRLVPNPRKVRCDIKNLPFKDSSFDLVLVIRLLQHFSTEEKIKAIDEISRVTRRWVVLSFYRINTIHRIERRLTGRPPDIGMIGRDQFREIVESFGLRLVKIRPLFSFHAQTLVLLKKI